MIVPGRRRCRADNITKLQAMKVEGFDGRLQRPSATFVTYLEAQLIRAADSVLISRNRLKVSLDLGACALVTRLACITTLLLRTGGGALVS
jgi:hypothetical protein